VGRRFTLGAEMISGPAYLIFIGLIVGFLWFAFWHSGRKVAREIAELKLSLGEGRGAQLK
jgi:cbb3-type cytochrome oxidase subunit 3